MKYITTKAQCQQQIDKYKNVCSSCGGKLIPLKTVDNSHAPTYWCGCKKCMVFDNGVQPKIYKIAKKMVIEKHFRPYSHSDEPIKATEPKQYEHWLKSQIRGASRIVHNIIAFYNTLK